MYNKCTNLIKKNITLKLCFTISLILLIFLSKIGSFCDEYDVMTGSWLISKGWVLYKDIFSHHMPFPYYFMSIFVSLGFDSAYSLRIIFALVIFSYFVFLTFYFRKKINKEVFAFSIVLYAIMMPFFWGQQMLADSFFAMATGILFLEIYSNPKLEFSLSDQILISIATFIAITSTLIAFYPFAIFFIVYIIYRIRRYFLEMEFKKKLMFDIRFCIIVLLPFFLWFLYMVVTKSLNEFIINGIKFNTDYYSQFTGGDTPISLIKNHIKNIPKYFIWVTEYLLSMNKETLLNASNLFINLMRISLYCFLFVFIKKGKYFHGAFLVVFAYFCYMRGDSFHGTPFYIICIFILSIFLDKLYTQIKNENWTLKNILILTSIFSIFSIFIYNFESYKNNEVEVIQTDNVIELIKSVTSEEDSIWCAPLSPHIYFAAKRMPADKNIFYLPWQSIVPGNNEKILNNLNEEQPKVIYFDENADIWGHILRDYGSEIYSFIQTNYFTTDVNNFVYFNNKYKDQISKDLKVSISDFLIEGFKQEDNSSHYGDVTKTILEQEIYSNYNNLSSIDVLAGTFLRSNQNGILHFYLKDLDGNIVANLDISLKDISDNSVVRFYFKPINNSADKKYILTISVDSDDNDNMITFYSSSSNILQNVGTKIDGKKVEKDLYFKTYYQP